MGDSKNNFYIYEWYNIDNGEVFYVGKGRNSRYKNITQRNQYFKNYHNKYKCDVRKVVHSLSENKAFEIEKELIAKYREIGQCQCNLTDGGDGATLPEGSWQSLYQKLTFLYNIGATNYMPNEDEYFNENLKSRSIEELESLYEQYEEYKEDLHSAKELGLVKPLDGYEMMSQYKDIVMLTDLIATDIAKSQPKFKSLLQYKDIADFICVDFDTDEFIGLIFANFDYAIELAKCIGSNLRLLKQMQYNPTVSMQIKLKSFTVVEDHVLRIRFNTKNDSKIVTADISIYDIVWGILIYKLNKNLLSIIYEEILASPIIR